MTPSASTNLEKHHQCPYEIISYAIWLYFRFPLRHRDVEELLVVRGVSVSNEALHKWCRKFDQAYANALHRRRPRPDDKWGLDYRVGHCGHSELYQSPRPPLSSSALYLPL